MNALLPFFLTLAAIIGTAFALFTIGIAVTISRLCDLIGKTHEYRIREAQLSENPHFYDCESEEDWQVKMDAGWEAKHPENRCGTRSGRRRNRGGPNINRNRFN